MDVIDVDPRHDVVVSVERHMHALRNVWYAAALPDEVGHDNLLSRTIIGQPIVFYRREDGGPIAMADRCPHRFAPLSRGRLVGDVVQCGYHGLEFDAAGGCARNPYGPCLDTIRVKVFPVLERHGLVWIWLGENSGADPWRIPDLSALFSNGRRTRFQYYAANYRTDILVDNLLDLSHVAYLHPAFADASASGREPSQITVSECGSGVVVVNVDRQRLSPLAAAGDDPAYVVTTTKWYPGKRHAFRGRTRRPANRTRIQFPDDVHPYLHAGDRVEYALHLLPHARSERR